MIRTVRLSSWRNYRAAEVRLGEGTTFVVASNGVGKTSLAEAVRFALFGSLSVDSASPIRVGAQSATASVELVLPDGRVADIERSLTLSRGKPVPEVRIRLNGADIADDAFALILAGAYGAEPGFMARVTMPAVSKSPANPAALGLETHLGQYFGIDGLHQAVAALKDDVRTVQKQIRQIKVENAATARQLTELEAAVTTTTSAVDDAETEHTAAREVHATLLQASKEWHEHADWILRAQTWMTGVEEVVRAVLADLRISATRENLEDRLTAAIEGATTSLEQARIGIAVRLARLDLIRANRSELDADHDDCPVCRRPLDDATVASAHRAQDVDLVEIEGELVALRADETAVVARRDQARALLQRYRSVPSAGPEPASGSEEAATAVDSAAARVDAAFKTLVSARADQTTAARTLAAARAADGEMRTLAMMFRREAALRVALDATVATRDELLEQTVGPLAAEVKLRWGALFPHRGSVSTRADATMTRDVDGYLLPFDAFSTGESISATIVLRLLVAEMATKVDFCWFDEPLEHLDPDVRRHVANVLASATGPGRLRQVVVTTYEEPLARQLHLRDLDRVHLIDVRSESSTASRAATPADRT